VLRLFAALELLHACALVHDDVIDKSDTAGACRRRTSSSRPCTASTTGWARRSNSGSRRPSSSATSRCVGRHIIAAAELTADTRRRVQRVWSDIRTSCWAGQYLDIVAENSGAESIASAMKVNTYKTASYTISRPLQFGAAIAADRPDVQTAFHDLGTDLGVAFQLPRRRARRGSAILRSPASRRATTCARASAPCCSPRPSNWPTSPTR